MKFANYQHTVEEYQNWYKNTMKEYEYCLANPEYYFLIHGESDPFLKETVSEPTKKPKFSLIEQQEIRKLSIQTKIDVLKDYSSNYVQGSQVISQDLGNQLIQLPRESFKREIMRQEFLCLLP